MIRYRTQHSVAHRQSGAAVARMRAEAGHRARTAAEDDPTHWIHVARRVANHHRERALTHRDERSRAIADALHDIITGCGFRLAARSTEEPTSDQDIKR